MSLYYERFRHCPCCGAAYRGQDFSANETAFRCASCRHTFYQNSIPAVSAVIPRTNDPTQVVLITRAHGPAHAPLALPGGFTGYGELPERTVIRETREETLLEVEVERVLLVHLIDYVYEEGHLVVLEHAFLCRPVDAELGQRRTPEASGVAYYGIDEVLSRPDRLAFPEHADVLSRYRRQIGASRALAEVS